MTKQAAIYARYSSDLQSDKSIEDQVALCRAYGQRNGYRVVATFEDRAVSGASIHGRPGIQALMQTATDQKFDAVIAESLSRIGRDQEDRHRIHKQLAFRDIDLITPSDGIVTPMINGIRGIIDQQFLDDQKRATRRGMEGVVRGGKSAGGRCYGYRPAPRLENGEIVRGDLEIVAAEADVIRRIFREYVDGRTPRQIAHGLNRDHIAPPRGRQWNASTLNGSAQCGTGIPRNSLYAGRREWNRTHKIKNPDTGKRVQRVNPASEHVSHQVPHLAIVPVKLFEAAQSRKAALTKVAPHKQRAPKRMLSGLLRCGCCGGGMSIRSKDKSGRYRVGCSNYRENGACREPTTCYVEDIEVVVIDGLRAELKAPDVLKEYAREYHAERQRLAATASRDATRLEKRRGEIAREVDRLVDLLAKGIGDPQPLGDRMNVIMAEGREIDAQLEAARAKPTVVALHPAALKRYEQQLDRLAESIGKGIAAGDVRLAAAIRDLVETVTVRRERGGIRVEIAGKLNALLGDRAFPNGRAFVAGNSGAGCRI
jgi:DNA invertase Pin-like site-specific DNA recombinase